MTKVPPLGLRPRFLVMEERLAEIDAAIYRHLNAHHHPVPEEWWIERNEIIEYLQKRNP